MTVRRFEIEEKHRRDLGFVASPDDFTLSSGSEVDTSLLIDNPSLSLYCFDEVQRQAVFVELPDPIILTEEPFVYQAQHEHAQRVFTAPFQSFNALAKSLPAASNPIFIHITGRSGSTLLNHALNASGLVKSLSEPDVISQFASLRHQTENVRENELQELADSTMRFLFKNHHAPGIRAHAVKFRNQGTLVMDLFQAAYPNGKNLFLYRDVVGFVSSFQRILRNAGLPEGKPFIEWRAEFQAYLAGDLTHMSRYVGGAQVDLSIAQQMTLWWIAVIEWYLAQQKQGVPAMAISYADLVTTKEKTLESIFRYCGISTDRVTKGLLAYARDSQEGTLSARENPLEVNSDGLTADELNDVQRILSMHPVIGSDGFSIP